ncbi:hypothetical protein ACP275_02G162400 [Erythranthe tilingii]
MVFIRSKLMFMLGIIGGAYVAQNYDVPNIKNLIKTALLKGKTLEQTYRKPNPNSSTNHNLDE